LCDEIFVIPTQTEEGVLVQRKFAAVLAG
jgi:hypothetical protein